MNNEYLLMHKNIPVCSLLITPTGEISHVEIIRDNFDHFPVAGKLDNSRFIEWWKARSIPSDRPGVKEALNKLGYVSSNNALIDNLALSLTDCYWLKPRMSSLTWEEVNLFTNDFVDTIGELQFQSSCNIKQKKNKLAVASSIGELKKKWCIDDKNKRVLVKGNMNNSYQQSLNEVFISNIHDQLGMQSHVKYDLVSIKVEENRQILGCSSNNFCNENVEFVSAWDLIQSIKHKNNESYFSLFRKCWLDLGMKEEMFDSFMDYMIMTDYLFTNIDRHLNNFGILRDSNTLRLIGFAPIFDSSVFDKSSVSDLPLCETIPAKPLPFSLPVASLNPLLLATFNRLSTALSTR